MNFKRYNESDNSWTDSHYIKGTDTDTITTLPAIIYPLAQTATLGLKGNAVQNGTPTPTNPIMPEGTGERTVNLFDKLNTTIYNAYITDNGSWLAASDSRSIKILCEPNTEYTISVPNTLAVFRLYEYYDATVTPPTSGVTLSRIIRGSNLSEYTFTTSATSNVLIFQGSGSTVDEWFNALMLNTGSTALPYESYGYKIPISSADIATPIYLGEVQSVRQIKKLVLDGTENWTYSASEGKKRVFTSGFDDKALTSTAKCTHFVVSETYVSYPDSGTMVINFASTTQSMVFGVTDMTISSADDFKAYLTQQYAAGTPVTVWYVLATEETAVVNEPLMRIGDYADSLSGINITTTPGANTIDVDTTVKPSEVTAAFSGWHPVADVHERDNGAWT